MPDLVESFVSINGEGQRAGQLALFLRFAGCNLRCAWCDTAWANEKDVPFTPMTSAQLTDLAEKAMKENGIRTVTLTGGEPLLQKDISEVIRSLMQLGLRVEIETNGSVPLGDFISDIRPVFTMDYKLPSSGMESRMCTDNIPLLCREDSLKFVCGSMSDLERAAEIIQRYQPACEVFLSPVFGQIDPTDMVDFMKTKALGGIRLQLQLHKFIWDPLERGV